MNKTSFIKKIKPEYILLTIILIFALFLRLYALGTPVFWIDEASSSIAAKNIIEKGIPVLDSGWLYSRSYLFHYTQAFFMLFKQNEFFARFPSVIFGLLTILLAFKIGKEYSKTGGIISALFMSVFYLEVFFSRQARFYQLFQLAFFASLYFLYKSRPDSDQNNKKNKKTNKKNKQNNKEANKQTYKQNNFYLYLALICFFIAYDTQIQALVLAPFFIIHILYYNKQKWLAILPAIPLLSRFIPAINLSTGSANAINYASDYYSFAYKMRYLLILFIPGVIWSYVKKKRLTLMLILPSIITLIGVFTLKSFALRYSYFFVFPLVLYSSLCLSYLYERFGKIIIIAIIAVLLFPSNLFFPFSYVNIIKPVSSNLGDYSAPFTNYKAIPEDLVLKMKNSTIIGFFSSDLEWYIKKPNFVIPFTMTGVNPDEVSYVNSSNVTVDRYSGALILNETSDIPNRPYYVNADKFSTSRLTSHQKDVFDSSIEGCNLIYDARDLRVWGC